MKDIIVSWNIFTLFFVYFSLPLTNVFSHFNVQQLLSNLSHFVLFSQAHLKITLKTKTFEKIYFIRFFWISGGPFIRDLRVLRFIALRNRVYPKSASHKSQCRRVPGNFGISKTAFQRSTLRENCPYSEFFWSVFFRISTEYREILRISPYLVWMRENMDQKTPNTNTCYLGPYQFSMFVLFYKNS